MLKTQKIVAWMVMLLSLVLFSACGGEDPGDGNDDPNKDGTTDKNPGGGPDDPNNPDGNGPQGCEVDDSCGPRGNSEEGDACSSTTECKEGLGCRSKVCTPVGGLNELCLSGDTCNGDLECRRQADKSDRCVEVGGEGQPCPQAGSCDGELVCRKDASQEAGASSACYKKLADGEDCQSNDDWCESGSCNDKGEGVWACETALEVGATCNQSASVCGSQAFCHPTTDKCTAKGDNGEPCDYSISLQLAGQNQCLHSGTCWYNGTSGDECMDPDNLPACVNDACADTTRTCVNGICLPKFPAGNYMCGMGDDVTNELCLSGNCKINGEGVPATCN